MGTDERQYLIIRADASLQMGIGHVMRCLALAQNWQLEGGHAIILSYCESDTLRQHITDVGIEFMPIADPYPHSRDLDTTLEVLGICSTHTIGNPTWLILDGYHFDSGYQQAVRTAGYHLLVIDDIAHLPAYHADILLNQNLGAEKLKYNCDSDTTLLLGARYVLLRQEFLAWRDRQRKISKDARKVLVTMGGSDPDNVTLKVIQGLEQVEVSKMESVVIVGSSNSHYEMLQSTTQNLPHKIRLERNVSNMPDLMYWADVAITAGGSTCWELAFMNVPSIVMAIAENQLDVVKQLDKMGMSVNLGWHHQVASSQIAQSLLNLLASAERRNLLVDRCHTLIDGDGVDRVLAQIRGDKIRLRRVREVDKYLLWEWANAPEVRAVSFSTDAIPWEQHIQWFASKQKDPNCIFFLALSDADAPLGQVRFDVDGVEATISISLDAKYRGHGYGGQIITLATQKLYQTSQIQVVHAYIKEGNQASTRAFLKAKFLENNASFSHGQQTRHLILERERKV